jgi:hypothetical protein
VRHFEDCEYSSLIRNLNAISRMYANSARYRDPQWTRMVTVWAGGESSQVHAEPLIRSSGRLRRALVVNRDEQWPDEVVLDLT